MKSKNVVVFILCIMLLLSSSFSSAESFRTTTTTLYDAIPSVFQGMNREEVAAMSNTNVAQENGNMDSASCKVVEAIYDGMNIYVLLSVTPSTLDTAFMWASAMNVQEPEEFARAAQYGGKVQ